ncbi:MAG: hypothetical protein H7Y20_10285, partial [Bryobacteraceae bacterium]|nr:hypothetical protein [Bryobacteraceae bacterium]
MRSAKMYHHFGLVALAFLGALASPMQAQTFAPIPGLSFTKPFAGPNPLPQTLTVKSTGVVIRFLTTATTATGGNWLSVALGPGCFGDSSCNTTHDITVAVNPVVTLAAGTYTGQIVVASLSGAITMTIPVALTIAPPTSAFFDNLPGQVSFSFRTGGLAPPAQTIQLRNGGTGTLNWTLTTTTSDGGNWLSASAASGAAPSQVTVALLKQNLPGAGIVAGTFTGRLVFASAGGSVTVPVSVTVGDDVFSQVNALSFTKVFAGADPLTQNLTINSTGDVIRFFSKVTTASGGDWLTISRGPGCFGDDSCNTPHQITVKVNPGVTLAAGSYTGQIVFTAYSGTQSMTVPVILTIAPSGTPFFDNLPGEMNFSLRTGGLTPPAQSIEIRNGASTGFLDWTLATSTSDGGNWFTVSALGGTSPSTVTVGVSVPNLPGAGLVAGTFTGQIVLRSATGNVTVPVRVTVGADVFSQMNAIAFTKLFAGANPLPQTITVNSTGADIRFFTTVTTATGGNWLSISRGPGCYGDDSCNAPHQLTVAVNPGVTLAAGTYTGQIVFTSYSGALSMTVPVTFTIASPNLPFFDNLPGQVSFSLKTGGLTPPAQPIQVRNGGSGILSWTVATSTSDGSAWLSASVAGGTAPSQLNVSILKQNLPGAGLVPGTFTGRLIFGSAGGTVTVPVSVVVGNDVFSQVNAIDFTKVFSGLNPLPQALTIASTGDVIRFVTTETTASGGQWLSVSRGPGCYGDNTCNTP